MRCVLLYEPVILTRAGERRKNKGCTSRYVIGDGFAYNSIHFGKSEMRDFAKQLRREGWKVTGSMKQGYYEAFQGRKHRVVRIYEVD